MANLEEELKKFGRKNKGGRVLRGLVVGDLLLDKYVYGNSNRTNPEDPDVPLVQINRIDYFAGGAANVAQNVTALGIRCDLYGVLGNDSEGDIIRSKCGETGVTLFDSSIGRGTIVKRRVFKKDPNGTYNLEGTKYKQMIREDENEENLQKIDTQTQNTMVYEMLRPHGEELIYDFVILSDYNKVMFGGKGKKDLAQKVIAEAKKAGIPVIVDPKPENIDCFKGCTIVRPNELETEIITGIKYNNGEARLLKMGRALTKRVDAEHGIITCGADGAYWYDAKNNRGQMLNTSAKKVVDVAGAGDTFAAILAAAYSSGIGIETSVRYANCGSGIVVEKPGIATTNQQELKTRFLLEERV